MNGKWLIGLLLGAGIGLACRLSGIPVPAPPALAGALLVVAMTAGYQIADRWFAKRAARHADHCGGPSGRGHGAAP